MTAHPVQITEPVLQPKLWPWALGALVLLSFELYFLLYDFHPSEQLVASRTRPVIATFFSGTNEVRKKQAGTITWMTPNTGQELYFEDSIMTLPESTAQVGFLDGSELSVEAESLVVLSKTPLDRTDQLQEIVVRLVHGSFHKRKGGSTPLVVELGAERIEDKKGDSVFSIRHTQQGAVVSVTSGKVLVVSSNAKKTEVQASQRAVLSQNHVQLEEQASELQDPLPSDGTRVSRLKRNQPVQFSWTRLPTGTATTDTSRLTLSNSSDFLRVLKSIRVSPKNNQGFHMISIEGLKDETYFWRIESTDGKVKSVGYRFELFTMEPPEILESTGSQDTQVTAGESVLLRLKKKSDVKSFQVEFSSTSDFKTLIPVSFISTNHGVEIKPEKPGIYFWRVRSNYGTDMGVSDSSESRRLVVTPQKSAPKPSFEKNKPKPTSKLKAPKLFKPKIRQRGSSGSVWKIWDWVASIFTIQSVMAADESEGEYDEELEVDLEWEKVKEAKKYHLQVSDTSDFKKVLVDEKLRNAKYTFYTEKKGRKQKFYFRVALIDEDDGVTAFSDAVPFEIADDPKSEEKRTFFGQRRLEFSAGPMVHYREITQNVAPRRVRASGMLPTFLSIETRAALSKRVDMSLAVRAIFETAEATTSNVERKTQPIHVFTAWAIFERKLFTQTGGVGFYGTTSQTANWVKRELLFEQKPLSGFGFEFKNLNTKNQNWHWRAVAGVLVFGTLGADLSLGVKRRIFSSKAPRTREFQGFHIGAEGLGRLTLIERAVGSVLKVGYAF